MSDEQQRRPPGNEERAQGDASETQGGPEGRPRGGEPGGGDARQGIPGKGFDAGTGYGGAGGDSAYEGESSYGGQAGYGGSTTRGAYGGGRYGRSDDPDAPLAGSGRQSGGDSATERGAASGGDRGANESPPSADEGAEGEDELDRSG